MPRLPNFGDVEGVPCDQCGETLAVVHLAEVSLCDNCFEPTIREILKPLFGREICATILWAGPHPTVCLEDVGHGFHD